MKYPDDFINKVICGDCLELMKQIPDKSIDLVFVDPPYNVGKDYGPTHNDNMGDDEYKSWIKNVIKEVKRISVNSCWYIPAKYHLFYWSELGDTFKQIILSYSPEGAIRWGYVNQYSTLLCDRKPMEYCKNVWHNRQMPGLGFFFRENNYGHPGYTSMDITRQVLKYFTKEQDLVLDCFNGTGTTSFCCKNSNRRFIGIEISPEYCRIAEDRLRQEVLF